MKNLLLLFSVTIVVTTSINAQPYIALHSQGHINYYETFQKTLDNALDNDTIYIPGGGFDIGNATIDKTLHIYGVGWFPDSVAATAQSILEGNLYIVSGADNGSLSGIRFSGQIFFGTDESNQTVNNYLISRCYLHSGSHNAVLFLSYNGSIRNNSIGTIIEDCLVVGIIAGGYCPSSIIRRNILHERVNNFENSLFSNNIFLWNQSWDHRTFRSVSNCIFENNYIYDGYNPLGGVTNSTLNNNIFRYKYTFPVHGNDANEYNIVNIGLGTFVNVPNNSPNYSYDYHLKDTSPGKDAGTDGTDIGIFGTALPFKYVPENPHISFKDIKSKLEADGTLDVEVHVSAQDR
ncbi:hypothetical protein [Saccharicrinis sp. 156]|uniref:hypothetical protein n=1 Tax=Saccharicrinis sp. 156 TaxID=3417574 RepID=UPI003D34AA53